MKRTRPGARDTLSRCLPGQSGAGTGKWRKIPQGTLGGFHPRVKGTSPESHSSHPCGCPLPAFMTQVSHRVTCFFQRLRGEPRRHTESLKDGNRGDKWQSLGHEWKGTLQAAVCLPWRPSWEGSATASWCQFSRPCLSAVCWCSWGSLLGRDAAALSEEWLGPCSDKAWPSHRLPSLSLLAPHWVLSTTGTAIVLSPTPQREEV